MLDVILQRIVMQMANVTMTMISEITDVSVMRVTKVMVKSVKSWSLGVISSTIVINMQSVSSMIWKVDSGVFVTHQE